MQVTSSTPSQVGGSEQRKVLKIGLNRSEPGNSRPPGQTEATRYLCAHAYLKRHFRDWVIHHFIESKHVALAESCGIDPVAVLKHCILARNIGRTRDILLILPVLILIPVVFSFVFGFFILAPVSLLAILLAWLIAFGILAWERWKLEFDIVRQKFTRKNFEPDVPSREFNADEQAVFRDVEAAQVSNVSIYGAFSPFVGSGYNINSWAIPVDLTKGKEDVVGSFQPMPFAIRDLYDEVSRTLRGLGLPNCSIEDKLCISGMDIRNEKQFLPDLMARPVTQIDRAGMDSHITEPSTQSRHYQMFRLVDWSGELILSTFFRLERTNQNLFIEVSYCLLMPIDGICRAVDNMNPVPSLRDWVTLLTRAAGESLFIWLTWPTQILHLLVHPLSAWLKEREVRKMIRENPAINFGATTSLREACCTSNLYRHYFQKIDREMYVKTLESKLLSCVVEFLDNHNVDTSDLKLAQTRIVNSGIIVAGGGAINAETLAVGRGASAVRTEGPAQGAVKFIQGLTGNKH